MSEKITSRISRLNVFADGIDVVLFVNKPQMKALGADIGEKDGVLTHARVSAFEWNAWVRSDNPPKAFGSVTFTAVDVEYVPNKDAAKSGLWRLNGFLPDGVNETAALPDFEELSKILGKKEPKKEEAPKGF